MVVFARRRFSERVPIAVSALTWQRLVSLSVWTLSAIAILVWIRSDPPAWDVHIYINAVRSLSSGHDPYADAMAIQRKVHSQMALYPDAAVSYSYVYSPITLLVLQLVARMPAWLSGTVYWSCYIVGILTSLWFSWQIVSINERPYLKYLFPWIIFFPGLLVSDSVLSGNIAFIIYPLVLSAALPGWRENRWRYFYLAVVFASCFKIPLLSLLVIPVLSARKQWSAAGLWAGVGLGLFVLQAQVWPLLFQHYLQAVELQFSYNRDFGSSPAGIVSGILFDHNIPYSPACIFIYLAYALPVFKTLFYISRRFIAGCISLRQWAPVLLLGTILLNPRIIEYDVSPIGLCMALVVWRFFRSILATGAALISSFVFFLSVNIIAYQSWPVWKLTEAILLPITFAAGCWGLINREMDAHAIVAETILRWPQYTSVRTTYAASSIRSSASES